MRLHALGVVSGAVACAAVAVWLFPRALPIIAIENRITREEALARADSFFQAHELVRPDARRAIRFHGADSLRTFVELAGGGHDSLNALVKGHDVAPFAWTIRAFMPRDPREARVRLAPDGRIIGFERRFAESDRRPEVSADSGRRLAEDVLDQWIHEDIARWKFVSSSHETRRASGRVDRSYVFERVGRAIGGAPIRIDVGIAGDTPARVRPFVEIPESFRRRYDEMRSANELLALIASLGMLVVAIAGIVFLNRAARDDGVRWRPSLVVGAVIGAFTLAAALNEIPASWFEYDTATSPSSFQAIVVFSALVDGALTGLLAALTLAAAETATRRAFPHHLDWWKHWTYRGTREVAARVGGGYAAAAVAFAYVAVFYLATRTLFGWWVPGEMLDDPNQIASPMPWISGIAISLNASVWEEALFRALPLSLLSLWAANRTNRRAWMAGGVVLTALIFGFAHSDYASWPPYSRGLEIFLDACFWAVLFLQFGLLVTVIAHFAYDLVLFGLFAASGSAPEYRISAAILLAALLSPALVVGWSWIRQRGFTTAPDDARFGAFRFGEVTPEQPTTAQHVTHVFTKRSRRLAIAAAVVALVISVARPPRPSLGPPYTATRERALAVADSMLRGHGGDPSRWKRLTTTAADTLRAWPRFVKEHELVGRAQQLARVHPPAWWVVRYGRVDGSAAERTEEWRVRVRPDGTPLDVRHIIPDLARRGSISAEEARRVAKAALARSLIDTTALVEQDFKETARPLRRDVAMTFVDTAVKLPAGASARAWVTIAGDDVLMARRGVELSEAFQRADRERETNRMIVITLAALVLLGAFGVGLFLVTRRLAPVVRDGIMSRRTTIAVVLALCLVGVLERLNGMPSALFPYDTTQPWSRFLGTTALGFVGVIPLAFFLLGIWLLLSALRRRVGIPMSVGATRESGDAMLFAGLGLGAAFHALLRVESLLPRSGMPRPPSTNLNDAVPVLSSALSIPTEAIFLVAVVGCPALVLAGVTHRWAVRLLILAGVVAVLASTALVASPAGDASITRVLAGVAMLGVVVLAIREWGTVSGWSWIVAALVFLALGEMRTAVYGETMVERVGAGLASLVAGAIIVGVRAMQQRIPSHLGS